MAHVLIVENDRAASLTLANIIEQESHEVHFASGGEEALDIYLKGGIDIVVTDLRMPDGHGIELIKALRSLRPETAIIVVSGNGPELLAEAESKGAFVAFSKPVDPHELLEAIAQAAAGSDDSPVRGQGSL